MLVKRSPAVGSSGFLSGWYCGREGGEHGVRGGIAGRRAHFDRLGERERKRLVKHGDCLREQQEAHQSSVRLLDLISRARRR
jgi:hypothetical protein